MERHLGRDGKRKISRSNGEQINISFTRLDGDGRVNFQFRDLKRRKTAAGMGNTVSEHLHSQRTITTGIIRQISPEKRR